MCFRQSLSPISALPAAQPDLPPNAEMAQSHRLTMVAPQARIALRLCPSRCCSVPGAEFGARGELAESSFVIALTTRLRNAARRGFAPFVLHQMLGCIR